MALAVSDGGNLSSEPADRDRLTAPPAGFLAGGGGAPERGGGTAKQPSSGEERSAGASEERPLLGAELSLSTDTRCAMRAFIFS